MKKITLLFLLISSFVVNSCVYYNTFFNAKKFYAEALKAKKQNNNEISRNISDKFNKTIGKCAYILREYPQNKWAANALLLIGKCYYEQGNFVKAQIKFEEFEDYYPNHELYPEAKLYLAKTHLQLREFEKAEKAFNTIFFDNIFSEIRNDAYFGYAQFYFEKDNYIRANEILSDLLERKISNSTKNKALFLKGKLNFNLENFEVSEKLFRKILKNDPTKDEKLNTNLFIAKCLVSGDSYDEARIILERLREQETRKNQMYKIKLYEGVCQAYLGNVDESIEIFENLKSKNNGKPLLSLINFYWGDVYFNILNDHQNALQKFNTVEKKHVSKSIFKETTAKNKISQAYLDIDNLYKENKYSKLADQQFIIAEYFNFDLSLPDSAISMYKKITENYYNYQFELDSLQIVYDSLFANDIAMVSDSISTDSTHIDSIVSGQDSSLKNGILDSLFTNQFADSSISDTTQIVSDSLLPPDTTKAALDSLPDSGEEGWTKPEITQKIDKLENIITKYDSIIHPQNLFMQFWTSLNLINDSLTSSVILDSMTQNYPRSKYTISAQKISDGKPYEEILFPEDPAKNLFHSALSFYYDDNDTQKAFSFIDSVAQFHQTSSYYPKAIFFKAFVLISDRSDTTAAKPYLIELKNDFADMEFTNDISNYFDGSNFIRFDVENEVDTLDIPEKKSPEYTKPDSIKPNKGE